MMKRLLAVLVGIALFTGLTATAAIAGTAGGYPHLITESVPWRFSAVSPQGYVDSIAFNRIGLGGATMPVANAETTTVVTTKGWWFPANPSTVSPSDSSLTVMVTVSDAGATSASVDSVYLAVQVSPDGKNWLYVGQVVSQIGLNPITAASPAVSSFPLANAAGTTTATPKVFTFRFHAAAAGSSIIADKFSFWKYQAMRFILVNKTVGSLQHNLRCYVTHWDTSNDD
jgi:hypothetical protein